MDRTGRRAFLTTAVVGAVSGCTTGWGRRSPDDGVDGGPPVTEPVLSTEHEPFDVFDAATSGDAAELVDDPPEIGRFDAAIDDPQFVTPTDAGFLEPDSVVFGAVHDGEAKAYPQSILVYHEIVNDTLGGTNLSATYCPLTGSALAFERGETSFGISGKLVNSNLVMYDRGTTTWWPQILSAGVAGPHSGDGLVERPLIWTSWERWRTAYPETQVLSLETGYVRDYDRDPYGSYDPLSGYYSSGPPARPLMHDDERFDPKTPVIAARSGGEPVAFEKDTLREKGLLTVDAAGNSYVAVYDEELDTGYVYRNPERTALEYEAGAIVDRNRNSWAAGELPLPSVNAFDAMWFAWAAFYPETAVVPESGV